MNEAILKEYGFKEGLDIRGDKIEKWPYDAPKPTAAKIKLLKAEGVRMQAIDEAEALYKTLSEKRVIDGYDLTNMFGFDFQRKKGGNVRMKKAGGKTETKTKAQTDAIEGKLYAYLNSCADALDADIGAIDSGDFSLANLKAL